MNFEEVRQIYEQYFYYILAAQIGIGLLFGSIPLILGIRRNRRSLGIIGFISAGVVGAISPILSLIDAVVFILLVLRKPDRETAVGSDQIAIARSPE